MSSNVLVLVAVLLLTATPVAAVAEPTEQHPTDGLVIDTAVGNGDPVTSGDGGPAREAGVAEPDDVAVAPDGTVYVATKRTVRAVDPASGTIRTVAGTGGTGFSGDGGPATEATFGSEDDEGLYLTVGPDGTLYVADCGNDRVRAVDPGSKRISTVAGSGERHPRFVGEGGPAKKATLSHPDDLAVGQDGTLYIVERHRVRAVHPRTSRIRTVVDDRYVRGIAAAGGKLYFTEGDPFVGSRDPAEYGSVRVLHEGTVRTLVRRSTAHRRLTSLAVHGGTLYIGSLNQVYAFDLARERLTKLTSGTPDLPLGDGGDPADASLDAPSGPGQLGLAVGKDGRVYISDTMNNRVRVVRKGAPSASSPRHRLADERIATLVGSGRKRTDLAREERGEGEHGWFYGDVQKRDEVDLDVPDSVAVAEDGTVYVADTGGGRIRVLEPGDTRVRTLVGSPTSSENRQEGPAADVDLYQPRSLEIGSNGTLYFIAGDADARRVAALDPEEKTVTTVEHFATGAGGGISDIAVDGQGAIYVANRDEPEVVCRIGPKSACVRVAGSRTIGTPIALAAAPDGTVYVGDDLGVIRALDPKTRRVHVVAGAHGSTGLAGDGGPATSAQLKKPSGLDVGSDGTLYIADQGNHRVRAVDPKTAVITTVAGKSTSSTLLDKYAIEPVYGDGAFSGDGGPAADAELDNPTDVAVGPDGEVYVADSRNNRVRVVGDVELPSGGGRSALLVAGPLVVLALLAVVYHMVRRRRTSRRQDVKAEARPR